MLERCVNSILKQDYQNYEIILVDGMSSDIETLNYLKVLKKNRKLKIITNKLQFPEGKGFGKSQGFDKSLGDFVLFIDQDNELQERDYLTKAVEIFKKEKDIFGIGYRLLLKKEDNLTNRYLSLVGTDPFFGYRSLDFLIHTKRLNIQKKRDYSIVTIKKERPIITGGNCFFYRRNILKQIGGYSTDVETIKKLLDKGDAFFAIPKRYTHHQAIKGFFNFIAKKHYWAKNYRGGKTDHDYLETNSEKIGMIKNSILISTLIYPFTLSLKLAIKERKFEWLMHAPMSLFTELIYILGMLRI